MTSNEKSPENSKKTITPKKSAKTSAAKKRAVKEQSTKKTVQKNSVKSIPLEGLPTQKSTPGTTMTEALGESFLTDLIVDWQKSGVDVIQECRTNKPDAYLRLIAAYAPKEFRKQIEPFEEVSNGELERRLEELLRELKTLGFDPGGRAGDGTKASVA